MQPIRKEEKAGLNQSAQGTEYAQKNPKGKSRSKRRAMSPNTILKKETENYNQAPHFYNDPIGVTKSKLLKETQLSLQIERKRASRADLLKSLSRLVERTDKKFGSQICKICKLFKKRWHK